VNFSPRFVHQADAADQVFAVLEQTGADPAWLRVEITERTALGDQPAAGHTLRRLRDRGVSVAIDDFGTGYASLSYLRNFPVDVVKLDRSFVTELDGGGNGAAIIEAVIAMSHALGMTVTAEGVEREEQVAALRKLHCNAAQGFWFARPQPADELEAQLDRTEALAPASA